MKSKTQRRPRRGFAAGRIFPFWSSAVGAPPPLAQIRISLSPTSTSAIFLHHNHNAPIKHLLLSTSYVSPRYLKPLQNIPLDGTIATDIQNGHGPQL